MTSLLISYLLSVTLKQYDVTYAYYFIFHTKLKISSISLKLHNRYAQLKYEKNSFRIYWQSFSTKKTKYILVTNDKYKTVRPTPILGLSETRITYIKLHIKTVVITYSSHISVTLNHRFNSTIMTTQCIPQVVQTCS